jgi:hypothetical protein
MILTVGLLIFSPVKILAQETKPPAHELDDETLKKANNPMAAVKALNVHNYVISSLYGVPGTTGNQLLLRYAQPVGKFLVRATIPFVLSSPPNEGPTAGLGDFSMFAIYSLPSKAGNQFGIGPSLTIPTGTNDLGQGKWQAGVSFLAFFARSRVVQIGTLLQWQSSFAGDDDRPDVSLLTPQVFFIWQAGAGVYFRSTGVWSFDLESGNYNVPIGLGIGKVIKSGKVVFNLFAEPQVSVLAQGAGQPKFQTFIGFNTQF